MQETLRGFSRGMYSNWLWHRPLQLLVDAGEGLAGGVLADGGRAHCDQRAAGDVGGVGRGDRGDESRRQVESAHLVGARQLLPRRPLPFS